MRRVVGEIEAAHEHGHAGTVAFKQRGRWYEMPKREWRELVRAGRGELAEERRAARSARRAELVRAAEERMVRAVARAEHADVVRIIKGQGYIRPLSTHSGAYKHGDRAEVRSLPSYLVRNEGRITLDQAAEYINENMPWLNMEGPNDVLDYFERAGIAKRGGFAHRARG